MGFSGTKRGKIRVTMWMELDLLEQVRKKQPKKVKNTCRQEGLAKGRKSRHPRRLLGRGCQGRDSRRGRDDDSRVFKKSGEIRRSTSSIHSARQSLLRSWRCVLARRRMASDVENGLARAQGIWLSRGRGRIRPASLGSDDDGVAHVHSQRHARSVDRTSPKEMATERRTPRRGLNSRTDRP